MESLSLYLYNCQKTRKNDLDKIISKICLDCNKIPIPPYREINTINYHCLECLKIGAQTDYPVKCVKEPMNCYEKLRVSCRNLKNGCKKQFSVKSITELHQHHDICKYSMMKVIKRIHYKSKWMRKHLVYDIFGFFNKKLRKCMIVNKEFYHFKKFFTNFALNEEKIAMSLSSSVPLSCAKIINNLKSLSLLYDIDEVNSISLFKDLTYFTSLSSLNFYRLKIINKEISYFTLALVKLANLTSISLKFIHVNLNDNEINLFFKTINNMKNLTNLSLDFSSHSIHKEAVSNMANFISKLTGLVSFVLILNQIRHSLYLFEDSQISVLAKAIGNISSLEKLELHVANNYVKYPISIAKDFPKLPNLKHLCLNLSSNLIWDFSLNEITYLNKLSYLSLILSDNKISDLTNFAKNLSFLKNLKLFSLMIDNNNLSNSNKIGNEDVKQMSDCLLKLDSLSNLSMNFNNNHIEDEAMVYLVNAVLKMNNLTDLRLDFGEKCLRDEIKKLLRRKFGLKVSFLIKK